MYCSWYSEIIIPMADHEIYTFPNGIRLVHKQVQNTKIAHCGFVLDIGSRDERPEQQGIAHFWEHMAFKGTKKRKSFHIINRLDALGGELNAYTTKEKICFYASVLSHHFDKAMDLLTDITFNSIFPDKQIDREKNVILEEMSMYQDNPEDAIQDEFENLIFPGHPLGNNILGTKTSVRSFEKNDFLLFIKQNLNTERLIFSSVSNLPFGKVKKVAEKYLYDIPACNVERKRIYADDYISRTKILKKNIIQAQCAIGRTAFPIRHKYRLPLHMLVNILGGSAMNSRLNLLLREKYGYVYAIDANYSAFEDTGMFSIFFGTEKKQLYKSVELVIKELFKMTTTKLGDIQLHKAKEQFIGQMAMAEENNLSLMLMMGKSLLDFNKIELFDEVIHNVRNIRADQLLSIAAEIFDERAQSFLYYLPNDTN